MSQEQEDKQCLTEADIDRIAGKAADRALEKVYTEVGKNVTKKLAWLVGISILAFAIWLASEGGMTVPRIP
tara:strand:- start:380 stop:592 length:213 start_codon:yes stop_codon:yes gene_type:complete